TCHPLICPALRPLSHRDAEPAQVGIDLQSDLLAGQMQDRSLFVAQGDDLRAGDDGSAGAGGAVDAGDVVGAADVVDRALEVRFRAAEHQAHAQAADRERIAAAMEEQRAAAAGRADEPPALEHAEGDCPAVSASRRRQAETGKRDCECNERCTKSERMSHGGAPLWTLNSSPTGRRVPRRPAIAPPDLAPKVLISPQPYFSAAL